MSNTKNSEQPAFPDPMRGANEDIGNQNRHNNPSGLTKREYFIAMAMQGILADPTSRATIAKSIAETSIEVADAVLAALERASNTPQQ